MKGFDMGFMAGMIIKAFETTDHNILWKKNECYSIGFSNHIIDQLKPYLSNRLLGVNLENCYSDYIIRGVPQGSILRPLLFGIYVNDLPQDVKSICFYILTALALFLRERMFQLFKYNYMEILQTSINGLWITNLLFTLAKTKPILFASKRKFLNELA